MRPPKCVQCLGSFIYLWKIKEIYLTNNTFFKPYFDMQCFLLSTHMCEHWRNIKINCTAWHLVLFWIKRVIHMTMVFFYNWLNNKTYFERLLGFKPLTEFKWTSFDVSGSYKVWVHYQIFQISKIIIHFFVLCNELGFGSARNVS